MKKTLLSLAGIAMLASLSPAQITKSGAGYLLRVKYTKGAVLRFTSTNSVAGPKGQPGAGTKFNMPMTLTVLNVKGDVADVQLKLGAVKIGGNLVNPGQTANITLNNRNEGATGSASNVGAQLPLRPVKIGQRWSAVAPVASGLGPTTKMTAEYTFRGLKALKGRSVAIISYTVSGVTSGSGTMALLVSDGTLFSNLVNLKLNMGGTAPLTVTSTLDRL